MGRHVLKYTAETRKKWLKEGRGQGEGADYKGWLTIHDVLSKKSTKHRLLEGHHMRMCHLLSNLEERAFLYYDAHRATCALYDQFRLDLDETLEIAKSLGIDHPRVPSTGEWWDMTTDLVAVAMMEDTEVVLPRSCKMAKDLSDWNNAEHAEIERTYWARRGRQLKFITEEEQCIPKVLYENLQTIKPYRFTNAELSPSEGFIDDMLERMQHTLTHHTRDCSLSEFCDAFDGANGLKPGKALQLAYHFIYRHELETDLLHGELRSQSVFNIRSRTSLSNRFTSVKKLA